MIIGKKKIEYLERSGAGANYRMKFGAQENDANNNSLYIKKRYVGEHKNQTYDESLVQTIEYAPQTAPKQTNFQPKKNHPAYKANAKRVRIKRRTDELRER
jgi:hypothetical protein